MAAPPCAAADEGGATDASDPPQWQEPRQPRQRWSSAPEQWDRSGGSWYDGGRGGGYERQDRGARGGWGGGYQRLPAAGDAATSDGGGYQRQDMGGRGGWGGWSGGEGQGQGYSRRPGPAPGSVEECVEELRQAAKERQRDRVRAAADALLPRVGSIRQAKEVSLALWGCAKANHWDAGLLGALLAHALEDGGALLRQANGHDHSNLWWALATFHAQQPLEQRQDPLPQGLSGRVLAASAQLISADLASLRFAPQGLSNVLWAYAKLVDSSSSGGAKSSRGGGSRVMLQALCKEVIGQLEQDAGAFREQHLSNFLWACATLDVSDPSLLGPLCSEAAARLEYGSGSGTSPFNEQDLSNMLWACATLDTKATAALVRPLCRDATDQLRNRGRAYTFKDKALSNMLWACARLQLDEPQLVEALAGELAGRLPGGRPNSQDVSNAVWAVAKMGRSDLQAFFHAAAFAVASYRVNMQHAGIVPEDWSNFLWGLGEVRHYSPLLLNVACEWLRSDDGERMVVRRAIGADCADMLLAFALFGWYDEKLTDRLLARLVQQSEQASDQELANGLWAVAALPQGALARHARAVRALLEEVEARGAEGFGAHGLSQLLQLHAELAHACAAAAEDDDKTRGSSAAAAAALLPSGLSDGLLTAAQKSQLQQLEEGAVEGAGGPSQLQAEVLACVQRLAQQQQEQQQQGATAAESIAEVRPTEVVQRGRLCIAVDAWLRLGDGREVVVLADEANQFLRNEEHAHRRHGRSLLRNRQLARAFGCAYNVVCVPHWEWEALQGEAAKLQYLRAALVKGKEGGAGGKAGGKGVRAPAERRGAGRAGDRGPASDGLGIIILGRASGAEGSSGESSDGIRSRSSAGSSRLRDGASGGGIRRRRDSDSSGGNGDKRSESGSDRDGAMRSGGDGSNAGGRSAGGGSSSSSGGRAPAEQPASGGSSAPGAPAGVRMLVPRNVRKRAAGPSGSP